jgi:hypothetical protein
MSQTLAVHVLIDPALVSPDRLDELMRKMRDFSPVLQSVGAEVEQGLAASFDSQGFGGWAPLKESTRKEKERLGYGDQPDLVRTGELRAALTERGAKGHKFLVGPEGVIVGVYGDVVPYAVYQARGTSRGLPARILIQVSPGTIDRIIQIITDWLGGGPGVRVWADAPVER